MSELLIYSLGIVGVACGIFGIVVLAVVVNFVVQLRARNAASPLVTDRFSPSQVQVTAERITGTAGQKTVTLQTANVVRVVFAHDVFGNLRQSETWLVRVDDRDGASIWVDGLHIWPATVFGPAKVVDPNTPVRPLVNQLLRVVPPGTEVEYRVRTFAATGQIA
jgi:hypothetical protein